MSVLVTMRVRVNDFKGTKLDAAKYAEQMKRSGCRWFKIHRATKTPTRCCG